MASKKNTKMHKEGRVLKSSERSEWLQNVAKSIGYVTQDVIKEMAPSTIDLLETNKEFAADSYRKFRAASRDGVHRMLVNAVKDSTKDFNDIIKNSVDDLKTGKIYNKSRSMSAISSEFGDEGFDDWESSLDFGDSGDDFDVDVDFGDQDPDSGSTVVSPNITVNANIGEDNPMVTAVNRQSKTLIDLESARNKRENSLNKINISVLSGMHESMSSGLGAINENLSMLVEFHSSNSSRLIEGSLEYFDKSYNKLDEILNELKSINKTNKSGDGSSFFDDDDEIFGYGGFNLKAYIKNVKDNIFEELSSNMLTSSIMMANTQAKSMGSSLLKEVASNPLGLLASMIAKGAIPKNIKGPIKELDEVFKEFFPAMGSKLYDYAENSNDYSTKGKLYKMLARVFGVGSGVKTNINLSNRSLDEQATFDGRTREAIITVIPTYLSKILSNVSAITTSKGYQTIAPDLYNYKTGKWENPETIYHTYREGQRTAATQAYDISKLEDILSSIAVTSKEDEEKKEIFKRKVVDALEQVTVGKMEIPNIADEGKLEDWIDDLGFTNENESELMKQWFQSMTRIERMKMFGSSLYEARQNLTNYYKELENDNTNNARSIFSGAYGSYYDKYEDIDKRIRYGEDLSGINEDTAKRYSDLTNPANRHHRLNNTKLERIKTSNRNDYEALMRAYKILETPGNTVADIRSADKKIYYKYHPIGRSNGFDNDNININEKRNEAERNKQYFATKWDNINADEIIDNYFENYIADDTEDDDNKKPGIASRFLTRFREKYLGRINGGPNIPLNYALQNNYNRFARQGGPVTNKDVKEKQDGKVTSVIEKGTNILFDTIFGTDNPDEVESEYHKKPLIKRADDAVGKVIDNVDSGFKKLTNNFEEKLVGEDGLIDNVIDKAKESETAKKLKSKWFGITDDEGLFDGFKRGDGKIYGLYDGLLQGVARLKRDLFGEPDNLTTEEIAQHMKDTAPAKLKGAGLGALAGGIIGGSSASMVGILPAMFINPAMGIALGMGGGLLAKSDSFKNWLFGEKDNETQERVGGFIEKSTQDFFKKHKKGIGIGAGVGLAATALGALPALPALILGGPVFGAVTGLGVSVLKGSEEFKNKFFPNFETMDDDQIAEFIEKHGDISEDEYKRKIKTKALLAAGGGILGTMMLGPVLGSALGVAGGLAISSDRFKDRIFGKKDSKGDRHGGLLGSTIMRYQVEILNPLKIQMTKWGYAIQDWFDDTIKGNLQDAAAPIKRAFKRGGDKFLNFADNMLDRIEMRLFGEKKTKGGLLTRLLSPVGKLGKGIINMTGKVAGGIIGLPFNIIGGIGDYITYKESRAEGMSWKDWREKRKGEKADRKAKIAEQRARHSDEINRMVEMNDVNKQLLRQISGATYDHERNVYIDKDGNEIDANMIKDYGTNIDKQMKAVYGKKYKKASPEEREQMKRSFLQDMRSEEMGNNLKDITSDTGKMVDYLEAIVYSMKHGYSMDGYDYVNWWKDVDPSSYEQSENNTKTRSNKFPIAGLLQAPKNIAGLLPPPSKNDDEEEGQGGPLLPILSAIGRVGLSAVKGVGKFGKSLLSKGADGIKSAGSKVKSKVSNALIDGVKNHANITKAKAEAEEKSKWDVFREQVTGLLGANLEVNKEHSKTWGNTFGKKGLITLLLLGMLASKKVREFLGGAINAFFEKGVPWIKENVLTPVGDFVTGTAFPWLKEQLGKLLEGIWTKINPFNDDTDEVTGKTLSDNDSKENIVTGALPVANASANILSSKLVAGTSSISASGRLAVDGAKGISNKLFGTNYNRLDSSTKGKLVSDTKLTGRDVRRQRRKNAVNKVTTGYNKWIDNATRYGATTVDNLDDTKAKRNANAGKLADTATDSKGTIAKFIGYIKEGLETVKSKIVSGMKKIGFNIDASKLNSVVSKILTSLDATKLGRFIKPITKVLVKVTANIASFGAAGIGGIIVNGVFGIWGAATGVTKSETANLFGINEDDVDWKMRGISSVLKAALNIGFMPLLDLASDIIYELTGWDFVRSFASLIYKLISNDKKDKKLETAQSDFDKELDAYNAARKQIDPNAKDLTHAQYNDMTNKSVFKKLKEGLFGTKVDKEQLETAQNTKAKMDEQIKADPSLKDNEAYMKIYNDTMKTIKDGEGGSTSKGYAPGIKGVPSVVGELTPGEESAVAANKTRVLTNSEKTWEAMAKYSDEWAKNTIDTFETASSATTLQITNMLGYTDNEGKLLADVATSDANSATTKKNTISSLLSGFWTKITDKVKGITSSSVASGGPNNPISDWMITSDFGARQDPISGNAAFHTGIDLAKDTNKNIGAFTGGTVVNKGYDSDYGKNVTVQDDMGNFHRYGHMSSTTASIGQRINRGDNLGFEGSTGRSTGSHLHYEVTDRFGNYSDPLASIGAGGPNIPFYNQKNYNNPYPGPGNPNATIASSGCGPTAISMVVEGLTGQSFDPIASCAYSTEVGARATSGTNMKTLSPKVAEKFGLQYSTTSSEDEIISKLAGGNTAIIANSGGNGSVSGWRRLTGPSNTTGGHYFVIGDYQNGRFKIWDPTPGDHSSGARKEKVIENADGTFSIAKDDVDKETKNRAPNYYVFTGSGASGAAVNNGSAGNTTSTTTQTNTSSGLYKLYDTLSGFVDSILGKGTSGPVISGSGSTSGATASANGTFKATQYPLTDDQLKWLAGICNCEQGDSIKGMAAEASLMANLFEKQGSKYGTGANGLVSYVTTGGWFASKSVSLGKSRGSSLSEEQIAAVKDVLVNGNRTLPVYVDEHDYRGDIVSVTNDGVAIDKNDNSQYIKDKTIIKNRWGSEYTFYCFPDTECDPFGYIDINTNSGKTGGKETSLSQLARRVGGIDLLTNKMKLIKISSGYPNRKDPLTIGNLSNTSKTDDKHAGVDLCFEGGDQAQILSLTGGTVKHAKFGEKGSGYGGYGNVVGIVDDAGYEHVYAHLRDTPLVKEGETVLKGQPIGYEGNTGHSFGNHLHYEVRNGAWNNTVHPIDYLKGYVHNGPTYSGDGATATAAATESTPSSGLYAMYDTLSGFIDTLLGKGSTTVTTSDTSTDSSTGSSELVGGSTEEQIWNYLKGLGYSSEATAGIMGNLRKESGLNPLNLEQEGEKALGMTDESYTAAVDSSGTWPEYGKSGSLYGRYHNDLKNWVGYGLAQWTYGTRKDKFLQYAKSKNQSIGSLPVQLGYLSEELASSYPKVDSVLRGNPTVESATDAFLKDFEFGGGSGWTSYAPERRKYANEFYTKWAGGNTGGREIPLSKLVRSGRFKNRMGGPTLPNYYNQINGSYVANRHIPIGTSLTTLVSGKNNPPTTRPIGGPEKSIKQLTTMIKQSTSNNNGDMTKILSKVVEILAEIATNTKKSSDGIESLNDKEFNNNVVVSGGNSTNNTMYDVAAKRKQELNNSDYTIARSIAAGS